MMAQQQQQQQQQQLQQLQQQQQQSSSKFELSLNGLVTNEQHGRLVQLLRGVCALSADVCEHEVALIPSANVKLQKGKYNKTALSIGDVPLRLRSHITERKKMVDGVATTERVREPWRLCHFGNPEPDRDRKKQVTVRSIGSADMGGMPLEWLMNLGYSLDFEFVRQGQRFVYANTINVSVTKMYKLEHEFNIHGPLHLLDKYAHHWLVEVSVQVTQEGLAEHNSHVNNLKNFAGYLGGVVDLVQVDHSTFILK